MFVKYDAAKYRALDEEGFEARRAEVMKAIEDFAGDTDDLTMDDLKAEVRMLNAERERRELALQTRSAKIDQVRSGSAKPLGKTTNGRGIHAVEPTDDLFSSEEYNRAFMGAVVERRAMPAEITHDPRYQRRDNEFTMVTGTQVQGSVVPTNLQDRIIQETEEHGQIYARVTKTSYPGGVEIPTMSARPTAKWITEDKTSDYQKLEPDGKITFAYYGLEVRLAQSFLSSAITLASFQAKFVELAAQARAEALDVAILKGSGTGQPLGIFNDTRVKTVVDMTAEDVNDWVQWHAKVKRPQPRLYRNGIYIMGQGTWDGVIETLRDSQNHPVSQTGYNPVTGEEEYRLMGKTVLTVDDSLIPDFESAAAGDVFAVFCNPADYAINSPLPLRAARWADEEDNLDKYKLLEWLDGKVIVPFGFELIKKKASA